MSDTMEVDDIPDSSSEVKEIATATAAASTPTTTEDDTEECQDLQDLLEVCEEKGSSSPSTIIPTLTSILSEPQCRYGPKACIIKERTIYALARAYCGAGQMDEVVHLLTGPTCESFFENVTKAKCAKVVRGVLDAVCALSPEELDMQAQICRNIIIWAKASKRTFLRQRVEAKLASVLFLLNQFTPALNLVNALLLELKKLDDKQLLVETHLVECKIHHGLRNIPKAKSALTASRTAANAIYVAPVLQSHIDSMSGVLHCEEGDYDTAHSYFLEAFEQLDQLDDSKRAIKSLKYMMLCRILDSLSKALNLSAKGGIQTPNARVSHLDISNIISSRQGVKYAGKHIEAMTAIAAAASKRSLKDFQTTTQLFSHELQDDLLVKHHLHILHQQLLESNLIRIIEPYSCVEIAHISQLMDMDIDTVERKLSQMILDGKFQGILDQGKGQLIVYEDNPTDRAMEKGLQVIDNMDHVVTSLFARSRALRTMMI